MKIKRVVSLMVLLIPVVLYCYTAAPDIYWEDSAAFQTASSELGIVHNPSFPLYVMMGKIFTLIPFASDAGMVNILSAILGALSVFLLFQIVRTIAGLFFKQDNLLVDIFSLIISLLFAVNYAVWIQAVRAEVYTLNLLLFLITIWLILRFHFKKIEPLRFAAIIGFVVGLGICNHYLIYIVEVFPILLVTILLHRKSLFKLRQLTFFIVFLLLALTTYIYLPIREGFSPLLNWGDFSTITASLKSILRFDEQLPIVSAIPQTTFPDKLFSVLSYFVKSISLPLVFLSAWGLYQLWKKSTMIALIVFLSIICGLLVTSYAAEFSIYNLDLLAYLTISIAMTYLLSTIGIVTLLLILKAKFIQLSEKHNRVLNACFKLLMILILTTTFRSNLNSASKHNFNSARAYAEELSNQLPDNSIFLAGEDNSFLPLLYLQSAEDRHQDKIILSTGALLRSDYRRKVMLKYNDLWYPVDWNDRKFSTNFKENIARWIDHNNCFRPVYVTLSEWTSDLIPKLTPSGFCFQYGNTRSDNLEKIIANQEYMQQNSHVWEDSDDLITSEHFARLLFNQAVYAFKHQAPAIGLNYCRWAGATDPTNKNLLMQCLKIYSQGGLKKEMETTAKALLAQGVNQSDVLAVLNNTPKFSEASK